MKTVAPLPGRPPGMRLIILCCERAVGLRGLMRWQWLHRRSSEPCVHVAVATGNLGWGQGVGVCDLLGENTRPAYRSRVFSHYASRLARR